jgi:cytochrome b561
MLYGLVIAMVFLGWAATDYRGWPVRVFGVVELPALAKKGDTWAHAAGDIHGILVYVLLGFIVLHIAGAAWHQFVKRDGVMRRML